MLSGWSASGLLPENGNMLSISYSNKSFSFGNYTSGSSVWLDTGACFFNISDFSVFKNLSQYSTPYPAVSTDGFNFISLGAVQYNQSVDISAYNQLYVSHGGGNGFSFFIS